MFVKTRIGRLLQRWREVELPNPPAGPPFTFPETNHKFGADAANFWRSQWYRGQSAEGFIGEYAPSTIKRKIRKGLPWDRVTLYETGVLYSKTSIKKLARELVIKIEVPYASYLQNRYGDRIWWLGGQWKEDFLKAYKAAIIKAYKNTLKDG